MSNVFGWFSDWLSRQNDVRRAAILGVGFGLLLCVIATLACALGGLLTRA